MKKPLCVFRVYFKPEFRPHAPAEFEVVAIPALDPEDVMRMLDAGFSVRGYRMIGWPAPNDPTTRLIDSIRVCHMLREHVEEVRPCEFVCTFRLRGAAPEPAAEAV